ncbi:MAG: pantetheine-phosphate adenylyltransferase [Firmicutes bacterium]|nr:pantetheine-phosphate adenylyltransferase [Bacillota bacterium]
MKALFPGTFDPFHNGHLKIAKRAASIFDCLVIGVAVQTGKNTLCHKIRARLISDCTAEIKNIEVKFFDGLTTDFAVQIGANVIVRGIRNGQDAEYEKTASAIYRHLAPQIEVVCLITDQDIPISSTLIRQLIKANADISAFIPAQIKDKIIDIYSKL